MYKYYWNGRLVRKSKSRGNYTHAVVRVSKVDGDLYVFGCSSRLDLAQKTLETALRVNPDYRIVELEMR